MRAPARESARVEPTLLDAIVDDDDAVRHSLRFFLEVIGHKVETFTSAVEFLGAELGRLACVILDHRMPHMTGLALARRLREEGNTIPILLLTGALSPDVLTQAAEIGVDRVLGKPASEDELMDFIDHSMPLGR